MSMRPWRCGRRNKSGLREGVNVDARRYEQDLISRLALSTAYEPGLDAVGQLVAEHGASMAVALLDGPLGESRSIRSLQDRWRQSDWLAEAHREADRAVEVGVSFLTPHTEGWPTQLDDLTDRAPLVLRVKGALNVRSAVSRSVAVVGARAATRYGIWLAEEVCAELAAGDWCVVSGGAMGIDAASHRGAFVGHGPTVAVSAGGVDLAVPRSNDALFSQLYEFGAVVSEVPLGAHPNRRRFLVRNRLIAALAPAVVVVEAALRSGALSTAREGDAIGRLLCAFPGPTTSAMSAGCHRLIRECGAALVTCADDVVEAVLAGACRETPIHPLNDLEPQCRVVLDRCGDASVTVTRLAEGCDMSLEAVSAVLHLLERESLVERTPRGWRRVVPH
mgnify:CR=1 FL=1